MDFKHLSWALAIIGLFTHMFGLLKCIAFIICLAFFILGCFCAIYIQRGNLDEFLTNSSYKNPLENLNQRVLGLNLVCDQKPIVLITPNIKIQTDKESKKKQKQKHHDLLLFKKNINVSQQQQQQYQHQQQYQQYQNYNNYSLLPSSSHILTPITSTQSCSSLNTDSSENIKKRSIIDTGIELFFKKHGTDKNLINTKEVQPQQYQQNKKLLHHDVYLDNKLNKLNGNHTLNEDKKWKIPFENIKVYTEKKKLTSGYNNEKYETTEHIQYGEDCSKTTGVGNSTKFSPEIPYKYHITLSSDAHLLDEHGSPKKKQHTMLSGNKQIDQLLHTIINYILRDFIDSWFCSLSDNKEFSEFRVRNCIEECVINICQRVKNTEWIPLMTTKLIDDIATHTRLYRHAIQSINAQKNEITSKIMNPGNNDKVSPQRKSKKLTQQQHKRNKSDTDLEWYFASSQKNVANSKFYTESHKNEEETVINDPESALIKAFFNQNNLFEKECNDERELENYLTHVVETIMYFTLPEEDFACIPLRTFLSTLLANVVFKPFLEMLSDPDFINLQVAKIFAKDPPPVEYFLKAIRQSTDLSELRAVRQLIIQEMSSKFRESSSNASTSSSIQNNSGGSVSGNAELSSLKFAQKLIDIRINCLQNSRDYLDIPGGGCNTRIGEDQIYITKLPTLSLDELLFKELARSYFLDYLSVLNLQKYVIFYLMADEWKCLMNQTLLDIQTNKIKGSKDEILKNLREKAQNIFKEYLLPGSSNYLTLDQGLIEALSLKINNSNINPDHTWFDSIMKYVYEKLKNEDMFLPKFYQSSGYKKLLLELDVYGQQNEPYNIDQLQNYSETSSDTNSGDINFEDEITITDGETITMTGATSIIKPLDFPNKPDLLDITGFKHSRSHSDCTGIIPNYSDLKLISNDLLLKPDSDSSDVEEKLNFQYLKQQEKEKYNEQKSSQIKISGEETSTTFSVVDSLKNTSSSSSLLSGTTTLLTPLTANDIPSIYLETKQKLSAKIINTAILSEGQYAVYAIQVRVVEDNQEKSWHVYRRYSKFLELKKTLTKKYPAVAKIPFPAKKTFQNTQRAVLEHRMELLNEFLKYICAWSEDNYEMMRMVRGFLEPDTDDRKIQGGAVIRTIEHIVNPLKTGMRTIRNMPDTLVGGFSKILLGKGPLKEPSFLEVNNLEQSSEYPALTSAIQLLDEIFDLQARSQWLRRALINRVLGAPWVSHTANKKIIHAAKSLIEIDKIELILSNILNSIWPNGKQQKRNKPREDSTKLRTRIAAQMALFALVFDDLKRVVGSETTRSGLLNLFGMWQNKKLNMRLVLILMNDILTNVYRVESMTKHCKD